MEETAENLRCAKAETRSGMRGRTVTNAALAGRMRNGSEKDRLSGSLRTRAGQSREENVQESPNTFGADDLRPEPPMETPASPRAKPQPGSGASSRDRRLLVAGELADEPATIMGAPARTNRGPGDDAAGTDKYRIIQASG